MRCIFSIRAFSLTAKKYSELWHEAENRTPETITNNIGQITVIHRNEILFPPVDYCLDEKGHIQEADICDHLHDLIDNPTEELIYLFEITNYDGALAYDIEELSVPEVFEGYDFRTLFKEFEVTNKDERFNELHSNWYPNHIHIIVDSNHWYDSYTGEGDGWLDVVGYLDKETFELKPIP